MNETAEVSHVEDPSLRKYLQPGDTLYYFETYRVKTKYTSVTRYYALDCITRRLTEITQAICNLLNIPFNTRYEGLELNVNEHPAAVIASQLGFMLYGNRQAFYFKALPGHSYRMPLKEIKRAPKDDA